MKRIDGINVIPFIDIMLVLLAIVLTTATFIIEGRLQIRLPEAASRDAPTEASRIELSVDQEGQVFFDAQPTTLDDLASRLDALDPETAVVLRVDAQSRFSNFVAVVDLLKARKMERLTILTQTPGS